MAEKSEKKNSNNLLKRFFRLLNREYLVFLFLLFLTTSFWAFLTARKECVADVKVCVKLKGCPKNVVLLNAETDTVTISIKDKGWVFFWNYTIKKPIHDLYVPFSEYRQDKSVVISNAELQRLISRQLLASSTVITSLKRDAIVFRFSTGVCKRVPVRFDGIITPKVAEAILQPDSVDVYASDDILRTIREIRTDTMHFDLQHDTIRTSIALEKMRDVKVIPDAVNLTLYRILFIEDTRDVRVECINEPAGKNLRVFTPKVTVRYNVDQRIYDNIKPEMFSVVADYNSVADKSRDKVELKLVSAPNYLKNVRLSSTESDYLIEEVK